MSIERKSGRVRWFNRERFYGFIESEAGDVFLHGTALPEGLKEIAPETKVTFRTIPGKERDSWKAIEVRLA